jgi:hypothetical protein
MSLSDYSCSREIQGFVMLGPSKRIPTGESGSADH